MGDNIADTEKMEVSRSSEKIDMTLGYTGARKTPDKRTALVQQSVLSNLQASPRACQKDSSTIWRRRKISTHPAEAGARENKAAIHSKQGVSVPNTTAAPDPQAKVKQFIATEKSPETGAVPLAQPKGIPLRFNFKAVANQTGVSLNDRFTGLKIRGGTGYRQWRGRGRGRTVTLQ
ncbi:hypothetical protein JZ751_006846 [Albula glossodonta]|uniref:Uncharacterized protein n=1 Tax=Albula glossodonta TaxID=121402 RepID=A0A8T2P1T9_9TELE|nr:hypothetical protein JZ751_006846 [Albula glossodonta]